MVWTKNLSGYAPKCLINHSLPTLVISNTTIFTPGVNKYSHYPHRPHSKIIFWHFSEKNTDLNNKISDGWILFSCWLSVMTSWDTWTEQSRHLCYYNNTCVFLSVTSRNVCGEKGLFCPHNDGMSIRKLGRQSWQSCQQCCLRSGGSEAICLNSACFSFAEDTVVWRFLMGLRQYGEEELGNLLTYWLDYFHKNMAKLNTRSVPCRFIPALKGFLLTQVSVGLYSES